MECGKWREMLVLLCGEVRGRRCDMKGAHVCAGVGCVIRYVRCGRVGEMFGGAGVRSAGSGA